MKAKWLSGLRANLNAGMNPKDAHGIAKVPLAQNTPIGQILMSLGKGIGSVKYGPYNYRKAPVQAIVYLEALLRHTQLLIDGEDFDRDTGYPHVCFMLACADIVADAWINGMLVDNRPLAGRAGELMAALNLKPGQPTRTPEENMEIFRNLLSSARDTRYMLENDTNGKTKRSVPKKQAPRRKK